MLQWYFILLVCPLRKHFQGPLYSHEQHEKVSYSKAFTTSVENRYFSFCLEEYKKREVSLLITNNDLQNQLLRTKVKLKKNICMKTHIWRNEFKFSVLELYWFPESSTKIPMEKTWLHCSCIFPFKLYFYIPLFFFIFANFEILPWDDILLCWKVVLSSFQNT